MAKPKSTGFKHKGCTMGGFIMERCDTRIRTGFFDKNQKIYYCSGCQAVIDSSIVNNLRIEREAERMRK